MSSMNYMMYDENKQFYSLTDSFLEGVWDWAITWEQTRLRKQFKVLAQHTHECTLTELSSHLHGKPVLRTQATSHYVHIKTDKPEKTDTFTLGVQLGCNVFSLDWRATTKLKLDQSILIHQSSHNKVMFSEPGCLEVQFSHV